MKKIKETKNLLTEGKVYWDHFTNTLDEDYVGKSLNCYLQAARTGNPKGMWLAGEIYYGMKIDLQFIPPSQCIFHENFVPNNQWANWKQAAYWLGESALLDCVEGKYRYAELLYHGHGVEKNYETALSLFLQVSNHQQNNEKIECEEKSCWYIQDILLDCPGVHRDITAALPHIEKMSKSCQPPAKMSMALMHLGGQLESSGGPKRDVQKAVQILKELWVKSHDYWCAFHLARIYEQGIGIPKDQTEAKLWQDLANAAEYGLFDEIYTPLNT